MGLNLFVNLFSLLPGLAQHKIQKATKAPSGNTSRKMLADISNLPQQNKTLIQDGNSQVVPITTKEYVDQLQKVIFFELLEEILFEFIRC